MLLVRSSEFGSDSFSAVDAISAVMDAHFGWTRFLSRVRGVSLGSSSSMRPCNSLCCILFERRFFVRHILVARPNFTVLIRVALYSTERARSSTTAR